MRMKITFKTLLLAAGLLVGGTNALAQIDVIPFEADFTDGISPFADPAIQTGNDKIGQVVSVYNGQTAEAKFAVGGEGAYTLQNGEEVTVSFDVYNGWYNNGGLNTFAILNSENVTLASLTYDCSNACAITDVTLAGSTASGFASFSAQGGNGYTGNSKVFELSSASTVTIKVNSYGGVSLTFVNEGLNINNTYNAVLGNGVKVDLAKLTINSTCKDASRATGYDNLKISSEISEKATTLYTVKYVDETGEQLKEPDSFIGEVGTTPAISHDDLRVDDKKYQYVSDDATELVEGDGNVITITYKEYDKVNYTVNATIADGTVLEKITEGIGYVGDNVKYFYKQVLNNNGTLYQAADINSGYSKTFTLGSEDEQVVKHEYSQPATPITNIVYLTEGEDVFTEGTGSSADIRCSMGKGGFASEKTEFVTLPAGKYYMVVSNRCSKDNEGAPVHRFYKGEEDTPYYEISGYGSNATWNSEEFTLSTETTLYMQGGDKNNIVDWLYIYGTETTEVSVEISPAGYSTFSSEYAVTIPEGLTAYIATATDVNEEYEGTITLQEVTGTVAANTGLLLKGDAEESYNLPVAAEEGESYEGENLLKPTAADGKVAEGNYIFAYNNSDASECGFYYLNSEVEVGAGKAYLDPEATTAGINVLRFVFGDGTATAIEAPAAEAETEGAVYNVAGQQVGSDYKGIVIKNGKKYLNK